MNKLTISSANIPSDLSSTPIQQLLRQEDWEKLFSVDPSELVKQIDWFAPFRERFNGDVR